MPPRFDVFVYGTLMDRDVLAAVLKAPRVPVQRLVPATLKGHRRFALKGRAYPSIAPDPAATVAGLVFEGCTHKDWGHLLAYEDVEYSPETVRVDTAEGSRDARVFMGGPGHMRLDAGYDWSFDDWLKRHKRLYVRRLTRT